MTLNEVMNGHRAPAFRLELDNGKLALAGRYVNRLGRDVSDGALGQAARTS